MQRINRAFWAKKDEKNGQFIWLPLAQHLEDTRRIAGLLWEHWLSDGQREHVEGSLSMTDRHKAKQLVQFLGATHDIGKATPAFQHMASINNSPDLDHALWEKLEGAGFTDFKGLQLSSAKYTHHSLAGQTLLAGFGVKEGIASIVGSHHGKPIDNKETFEDQKSYAKNYYQSENSKDPIHHLWQEEQQQIFLWALESNGFSNVQELPEVMQPVQVILSGILIMADWIASNQYYFPLISIDIPQIEDQNGRLTNAWGRWMTGGNWDPQDSYHVVTLPEHLHEIYKARFGFDQPRNMQRVFGELMIKSQNPGIIILEAPMGEGKTEAALVAAEILAMKTGRNGVFFGLPTQATSNGIFPRIEEWLEFLSKDRADGEDVYRPRLVHGKAALNESAKRSDKELAEHVDVDGSGSGSVQINEWFSGRKTANLDSFVVATVDQFLMIALKQKHLALRHLGFSKKVVIIDEVHAYDAYMSQYLYMAVTWMAAYDVPVIILSATLPADKREELVWNYIKGTGRDWDEVIKPENGLRTGVYPLITASDGNKVVQVTEFERPEVKVITIELVEDEELEEVLDRAIAPGGVVGVILNTVKRSQELTRLCIEKYGEQNVVLLHSRFIATERIAREKELLDLIGKGGDRPEKKIIIGTQVIEQSLDIDFDVLISDLAPMDLLIQRVGRLHRHKNTLRPEEHKNPVLHVLGSTSKLEFDSGSKAVYSEYLLARTQYFLPPTLSLPGDISRLVQLVYDQSVDVSYEGEFQAVYDSMRREHLALLKQQTLKADVYRISNPVLKPSRRKSGSLIGWLSNIQKNESEERANAQVRDSNESIEVIALKKIDEGYGFFGSEEDLKGRIHDPKVAKEIAKHTVILPQVISAPYNIDQTIRELEQYNLRYLKGWQNQPWLKGTLGIVFEIEENVAKFELNGFSLHYDVNYGLSYERIKNGKI